MKSNRSKVNAQNATGTPLPKALQAKLRAFIKKSTLAHASAVTKLNIGTLRRIADGGGCRSATHAVIKRTV